MSGSWAGSSKDARCLCPLRRRLHVRQSRAVFDVVEIEVVADIGARGVRARLEIPGRVAALRHGGGDQTAALLAREHARAQRLLVPARERVLAEALDGLRVRGIAGQVLPLERIGGEI